LNVFSRVEDSLGMLGKSIVLIEPRVP